jgi:hypothetical protein
MLSVELSIGWLKIRCARMRAHSIFDRCLGAFINTPSKQWCVLPHYLFLLGWIGSSSWGVGAYIEIAYGDDVPVSGAL